MFGFALPRLAVAGQVRRYGVAVYRFGIGHFRFRARFRIFTDSFYYIVKSISS